MVVFISKLQKRKVYKRHESIHGEIRLKNNVS